LPRRAPVIILLEATAITFIVVALSADPASTMKDSFSSWKRGSPDLG
jgi:hypothetical protein